MVQLLSQANRFCKISDNNRKRLKFLLMASTRNRKSNDSQIGPYTLDDLLLEQPFSAIYLAQHDKTNKPVFLVTMQPEAAKSGDVVERFLRRAETLSQLNHPFLLPLEEYGVDGKRPFAIMPHRTGQFLAEKLAEDSIVPTDKADVIANLELVKRLATGLAIAHPAGLIHHDLRPESIYLDEEGQPYLLDLVVPPLPLLATTQTDEAQPTELDYQSPEQMAGKALSGRSNIFSLGILLYRLLAGHKPALPVSEWDIFEQKGITREIPLEEVRPGLTFETYKAVRDSIWQKEWSRFETVDALNWALELAVLAESAPPPPPPVWRKPQTLKYAIPAVGLLLIVLLALLFWPDSEAETVLPEENVTLPAEPDLDESTTGAPTAAGEPLLEATVSPPTEEAATAVPTLTETAVPATPTSPPPTATMEATSEPSPIATATATLEPSPTQCVVSPPAGWVRYTIQADDSLSALGQATNTTVEQMMQVNCLDSILLSIGQEIWLRSLP